MMPALWVWIFSLSLARAHQNHELDALFSSCTQVCVLRSGQLSTSHFHSWSKSHFESLQTGHEV